MAYNKDSKVFSKDQLNNFLALLTQEYEVYAPIKVKELILFKNINEEEAAQLTLEFKLTTKPIKELFFLPSEELLSWKMNKDGVELKSKTVSNRKRVIFGLRPCDAESLLILEEVFRLDPPDTSFLQLRENTILITLGCSHIGISCFCYSLDKSPISREGSDIFLFPVEDVYYIEVITDKGKNLLDIYWEKLEVNLEDYTDKKIACEKELESEIKRREKIDLDNLNNWLGNNFSNPMWEEIAKKCLGCGVCTYLCPTCYCFDITDEMIREEGKRFRVWDSCSYPDFTKMAAHQPREFQFQRLRQRIMHKFKYFKDRFNKIGCVGCGRCREACPVNLDFFEILCQMAKL